MLTKAPPTVVNQVKASLSPHFLPEAFHKTCNRHEAKTKRKTLCHKLKIIEKFFLCQIVILKKEKR